MRQRIVTLAAGALIGLVSLAVICLVVLMSGLLSFAAAQAKPWPLEKLVAGIALHRSMGKAEDVPSPVDASDENLLAGAKIYSVHCAICHGLPQKDPSAIAKGMFPHPPYLMPPKKGVTDDEVGETYWKAKYGIRLTGMPGFVGSLSDQELWQVSQFLTHADKIPPAALDVLR